MQSIFSRFLAALGVAHTAWWSDRQFRHMTFKSLYGLSHLLGEYGIPSMAVKFADKDKIGNLTAPFLAQTSEGIFVIVTAINPAENSLTYDSAGKTMSMALDTFIKSWNGIALLAFPETGSREPDYASHRLTELVSVASGYALVLAGITIFAYFFITRHVYEHFSTILLTFFNCAGLYFSYLLVQKTLNIHTAASDRVCGVLEQGGCDNIMQLKVSKLFGVFAWSEVGFAYFGVSLATLLIFPHLWPALALCNLCCLPYTVWSIWYQKFRAKHWCTLCVGVQTTLWLLFFCYSCGGWLAQGSPMHVNFPVLLAVYLFAVLFLNRIIGVFKNLPCHEKNSAS